MLISPCKDCEKRYLGCHSECEDYFKYQEEVKAWNKKLHDEKVRFAKTTNQIRIQRLKILNRSH